MFVTVIIPIRNEERYIKKCIDSVIAQTYPKDKMEVFLVDGMSEDNTRELIMEYTKKYPFIKLLDNPKKIVPVALNVGIKNAKGDVIIRMDAHTYYAEDYIEKCVETLKQIDAVNVGGPIVTLPGADTAVAKAIALVTSHPFGVGNSKFRISNKAEYVDTVPFGAFRKEIFKKIGLFDERLIRNQDIEYNLRIWKNGGKVYLHPDIKSFYYNKATLMALCQHNFKNGLWNILTHKLCITSLSLRHYIPLFFILSIIMSLVFSIFSNYGIYLLFTILISYTILSILSSIQIFIKEKSFCAFLTPVVFLSLHLSYGFGSLYGILKTIQNK